MKTSHAGFFSTIQDTATRTEPDGLYGTLWGGVHVSNPDQGVYNINANTAKSSQKAPQRLSHLL